MRNTSDMKAIDALPDDSFIRLKQVLELIPVSRSTFYAGQKRGLYPKPISIGPRARGYRVGAIKAWLRNPELWRESAA